MVDVTVADVKARIETLRAEREDTHKLIEAGRLQVQRLSTAIVLLEESIRVRRQPLPGNRVVQIEPALMKMTAR